MEDWKKEYKIYLNSGHDLRTQRNRPEFCINCGLEVDDTRYNLKDCISKNFFEESETRKFIREHILK